MPPRPIAVTTADDPAVDAYRDIRERDLVGRQGRFVVEGEVVLRQMIAAGRFALESCLIAEGRMDRLADALSRLPADVPVHVAPQPVLDSIAGFAVHRGILAIGIAPPQPPLAALLDALPEDALVVVCIGIANHDNLGGILRNAAAFAADAVLIDGTSCDPLYRKAIRVSVGAALRLDWRRGDSAETLLDALDRRGFRTFALSPSAPHALSDLRPGRRTALCLGAEGPGLPEPVLARCEGLRIPMAEGFDSLNVATTSGIALHHLRALAPPAPHDA